MNLTKKLMSLIICLASVVFAEEKDAARIYTVCQRKLCLVSTETNAGHWLPGDFSGSYTIDTATLFGVYDSLRDYLYASVNLKRCSDREYQLDDVVFSFYEYYLQMVPYYDGTEKMIFINAYRRGMDKDTDTHDESPAQGVVIVFDGGSSFWCIVYHVDKGTFERLYINGHA